MKLESMKCPSVAWVVYILTDTNWVAFKFYRSKTVLKSNQDCLPSVLLTMSSSLATNGDVGAQ